MNKEMQGKPNTSEITSMRSTKEQLREWRPGRFNKSEITSKHASVEQQSRQALGNSGLCGIIRGIAT